MQQPGQQPYDAQMRLLSYRVNALEQALKAYQAQMAQYVTQKEHDLQLKNIQEGLDDIRGDIKELYKLITWMVRGLLGIIGTIVVSLVVYYLTHLP